MTGPMLLIGVGVMLVLAGAVFAVSMSVGVQWDAAARRRPLPARDSS